MSCEKHIVLLALTDHDCYTSGLRKHPRITYTQYLHDKLLLCVITTAVFQKPWGRRGIKMWGKRLPQWQYFFSTLADKTVILVPFLPPLAAAYASVAHENTSTTNIAALLTRISGSVTRKMPFSSHIQGHILATLYYAALFKQWLWQYW